MRSGYWLVWFIFAWPWEQMTVRHAHIPSDVGSYPVGNALLIHRVWLGVAIAEVGAWSREVKTIRFDGRFDAVGKLRSCTCPGVGVCGITEVIVTCETIVVRSRCQHGSSIFFLSCWPTNHYTLVEIVWMFRAVSLWSNYFLRGWLLLPKFVLFGPRRQLAYHKVGNFFLVLDFICGRSWITIVN